MIYSKISCQFMWMNGEVNVLLDRRSEHLPWGQALCPVVALRQTAIFHTCPTKEHPVAGHLDKQGRGTWELRASSPGQQKDHSLARRDRAEVAETARSWPSPLAFYLWKPSRDFSFFNNFSLHSEYKNTFLSCMIQTMQKFLEQSAKSPFNTRSPHPYFLPQRSHGQTLSDHHSLFRNTRTFFYINSSHCIEYVYGCIFLPDF